MDDEIFDPQTFCQHGENWHMHLNISGYAEPIFTTYSPYDSNLCADDRSGPLYSRHQKFFQSAYRYVHLKGAELLGTVAISK